MAGPRRASFRVFGYRNGSFMGTAGLAPSHAQVEQWRRREADLAARGGIAAPPDPEDAVPASEPGGEPGSAHHPAAGELRQRGREAAYEGIAGS